MFEGWQPIEIELFGEDPAVGAEFRRGLADVGIRGVWIQLAQKIGLLLAVVAVLADFLRPDIRGIKVTVAIPAAADVIMSGEESDFLADLAVEGIFEGLAFINAPLWKLPCTGHGAALTDEKISSLIDDEGGDVRPVSNHWAGVWRRERGMQTSTFHDNPRKLEESVFNFRNGAVVLLLRMPVNDSAAGQEGLGWVGFQENEDLFTDCCRRVVVWGCRILPGR